MRQELGSAHARELEEIRTFYETKVSTITTDMDTLRQVPLSQIVECYSLSDAALDMTLDPTRGVNLHNVRIHISFRAIRKLRCMCVTSNIHMQGLTQYPFQHLS